MSDQVKKQKDFSIAAVKLDKASIFLEQAIDEVGEVFAPVIRDVPVPANDSNKDVQPKSESEFETLILRTEATMFRLANKLKDYCIRSAV